jgi:FAD binding domain/Phenol hydroxylase, C-terminal dimerisation domain
MDVLAITDFPDFRIKSAIQSANEGNLLIIPREGGYLVRLYIELEKLNENERVSSLNITTDVLIAAARRILHPYTLEVKEIGWWSVYEIGQRLCDRFDDIPNEPAQGRTPRVFIAGDACHTHSPKAGQGMNVSMQDGFNLGWKLASVLRGRCSPKILHTYSDERQTIAKELIDFDRKWAKMFSAPPKDPMNANSEGVDPAEFQRYFVKQARFTAGTETRYGPSIISARPTYQHLAEGLTIGMRFHSAPVIRLADAKPVHLGHTVKADGRWRLFAFADAEDPVAPSPRLRALCEFLAESHQSPVRRYPQTGADIDSVIDLRAIFQQGHRELAIEAMPTSFCRVRADTGSVTMRRCSALT